MRPRSLILVALIGFAVLPAAGDEPRVDPQTALNEGNRLFRDGQIEAAVAAYIAGYSDAAPHPTLLYNLGTALHHLDRLPEAVLWYRRAAGSDDPWLEENLWLARRSLGSQVLRAGGAPGWLRRHLEALRLAAVILAWITLLAVLAGPERLPARATISIALLALSLYSGAAGVEHWGPRPAVILEDCSTAAGDLPAGTEAWVRRTAGGEWLISGSAGAACPPQAVALVYPT